MTYTVRVNPKSQSLFYSTKTNLETCVAPANLDPFLAQEVGGGVQHVGGVSRVVVGVGRVVAALH